MLGDPPAYFDNTEKQISVNPEEMVKKAVKNGLTSPAPSRAPPSTG
jgi:hypothetical protein